MPQLALAAIGTYVGGAVGGALGYAAIGAAVGQAVGAYAGQALFAPTQKTQGPRLTDLKAAQVAYGSVLPYIEGHPRLGGVIIWASDKREIATTTSAGGKGGPEAEHTSYTYEQDLLIAVAENPGYVVRRIWANGALVWTAADDGDAWSVNAQVEWCSRVTSYRGLPDQLPDPTYEAAVGTANAPAYRDRSTVFIEALQLGSSGQMPNLTFEISAGGLTTQAFLTENVARDIALTERLLAAPTGACVSDGEIRIWGQLGMQIVFYSGTGAEVSRVALPYFADIEWLGTGAGDQALAVFAASFLQIGRVYVIGEDFSRTMALSGLPEFGQGKLRWSAWGNVIAFGGDVGKIYLHNLTTAASITSFNHALDVDAIALTASTIYVLSGATITPYDAATYAAGTPFAAPSGSGRRIFATQQGALACANAASTVHVWDGDEWVLRCARLVGDDGDLGTGRAFHVIDNDELYAITMYEGGVRPVTYTQRPFDQFNGGIVPITYETEVPPPDEVESWISVGECFATNFSWDDEGTVSGNAGSAAGLIGEGQDPDPALVQSGLGVVTVTTTNTAFPQCSFYGRLLWNGVGPGVVHAVRRATAQQLVALDEPTLQEVVERQCERAGLPLEYVDASALASQTVRAMAISQISSPRQVIEMLAAAYLFTCVESEVLRFVRRGGAPAMTIPYTSLVAEGEQEPLPIVKASDLELPVQVFVKFSNVNDDYQDGSESSDRLISSGQSTSQVELPLGLTPREAKRVADAHVMDATAAALRFGPFSLSRAYAALEPTDVVNVVDADGISHRVRLTKRADADARLTFEAVSDDDGALQSQVDTSDDGYTDSSVVRRPVDTAMELLDIPLLADDDDNVGFYVVAKPVQDVAYPGGALFKSSDDVTYEPVGTTTATGTFGRTMSVLPAGPVGVFDEGPGVLVDVGFGELPSASRDSLLGGRTNLIAIGDEIIQFRDAALLSVGVYRLTGLLRGLLGTEWAIDSHAVFEPAVLLDSTVRRVPLQAWELGSLRYWKGVTMGRSLSTATAEGVTVNGVSLKPYAPGHLRRLADDTFTWDRRSRLTVDPFMDLVPLGEETESYDVEILDAVGDVTFSTTVSAPSADLSGETLDAGYTVRVYQKSARVGRGYPAELVL